MEKKDKLPAGKTRLIGCALLMGLGGLSASAATLWVDANSTVTPRTGSETAPFTRIQSAVDAARGGDTVYVKPGVYDQGERRDPSGCKARLVLDKAVQIVATGGAAQTRLVGRQGREKEGLGAEAVRCVFATRNARGATLEGLTLADGGARHTNGADGFSGGCQTENGAVDAVSLIRCVVTNCVGTRGGGLHGGTARETLVVDCRSFNDKGNCGGAAARYSNLIDCRVERCRGFYGVDYPGRTENCSFVRNALSSYVLFGGDRKGCVARDCKFTANRGGRYDGRVRYENCSYPVPEEFANLETWKFAAALQKRIDETSAKGGGVVTVPAGTWKSEGLELKSGVTLELAEGCLLEASTNTFLWPNPGAFVWAGGAKNVALVGKGRMDVHGELYPFYDGAPGRPLAVHFLDVKGLKIQGVTLSRPAAWTLRLQRCEDVHVRGVTIRSTVNFNNDGIDIEARRCLIEDCDIDADDDAICFKADTPSFPIEDVEVRNCLVSSSCNFIKFGTGSAGPVRRVDIHDCKLCARTHSYVRDYAHWRKRLPGGIEDCANGIAAVAIEVVDGGSLEDVKVRNLEISGCQTPIFVRHAARSGKDGGFLRNVLIENVRGSCLSRIASSITGVAGRRVTDITLRNIDLTHPGGATEEMLQMPVPEREKCYPEASCFRHVLPGWAFYVRHADNIRFENVKVRLLKPDARKEAFVCEDATGVRHE